jgi:alkanesulfonate monooxygenase
VIDRLLSVDPIAVAIPMFVVLIIVELLAVRMGEMWLPQLARQLASIDQFAGGRLCINIISSDIPGEKLESSPRYQRTREWMQVLRRLLNRESIDFHGEFVDLTLDPPRASTVDGTCPPMYFGGFSPAAKDVAAAEADEALKANMAKHLSVRTPVSY